MSRGTRVSESYERAVARLSELIDAAAIMPDGWNAVCAGFQEYFPDGRVLMQGYDTAAPYATPLAAAGWGDINFEVYFNHFAAINPWIPAWSEIPVFQAVQSDAVLPRTILERTLFYVDWIKPMGGADTASGIKITQSRDRMASLCVHYAGGDSERSHEALAPLLIQLAPRMRMALDCNRAVFRNQKLIKTGHFLHDLVDPAVVVDREHQVLGANAAAQELFATQMAVRVAVGDRLRFEDGHLSASFARTVDAVCRRVPGSGGGHEIEMRGAGQAFSISVFLLSQNLRDFALRGTVGFFTPACMALVIFRSIGSKKQISAATLRRQFGLTEQEIKVALALQQGGSLVDIAMQIGMAYETARFHLKSAFSKTGTHRQRELLALILEVTNGRAE